MGEMADLETSRLENTKRIMLHIEENILEEVSGSDLIYFEKTIKSSYKNLEDLTKDELIEAIKNTFTV